MGSFIHSLRVRIRSSIMSWCERALADHVDCAKTFLRNATTYKLPYEPGSYGENDRCAGTRHAYVECCNDPGRKKAYTQAQDSSAPLLCEMELTIHGKCIEGWMRSAIANGTDYAFLTHSGKDKCRETREVFNKCLKTNLDIQSGRIKDPTNMKPSVSRQGS